MTHVVDPITLTPLFYQYSGSLVESVKPNTKQVCQHCIYKISNQCKLHGDTSARCIISDSLSIQILAFI